MNGWIVAPAFSLAVFAVPAAAQDHGGHEAPVQQVEPAPRPAPHDHGQMQQAPEPASADDDHAAMMASMTGALGPYAMGREASGTAWQPDVTEHGGLHEHRGPWMFMGHVMLNGVYDWQDGPRGDEKAFISGMVMGSARRDIGADGTLNLRAMVSPEPFMGANGYPLLFAAGETANGSDTLIDRQHPHDLIMELSASYAHRLGDQTSVFVYGGLPGEPAFGPPAFMHRLSAMDSPEAPITHHWFDSTHITFGVLTAGVVHGDWKLEASQFRGREPDEDRYDIETGELDSTALRLSWNPTENLALQTSWADVTSPEALEPDEDEERWSVSGIYTRPIGEHGWWSATMAFSNKERSDGVSLDAWLAEAAWHPNDRWTLFARGETIETDELEPPGHGPIRDVARLSAGAIRDWRINETVVFGVGALVQTHLAPDELEPSYGGDPEGAMGFVRLKIG
ncbi:hypothetical protein [Terricaulis silvestris]|uniref:Porin n=1 Tax=Terricaulis silvestris TaxID=2686094 RepID=A0A6I6MQI5_9CAUL|nr:hypothetical protein [Terricaulis silvestris]QGZ95678.1 hypothetical protein DSM104635_02528 [Terricaulis silvestris]